MNAADLPERRYEPAINGMVRGAGILCVLYGIAMGWYFIARGVLPHAPDPALVGIAGVALLGLATLIHQLHEQHRVAVRTWHSLSAIEECVAYLTHDVGQLEQHLRPLPAPPKPRSRYRIARSQSRCRAPSD